MKDHWFDEISLINNSSDNQPSSKFFGLFILGLIILLILFRKLTTLLKTVNNDKIALTHYQDGWLTWLNS
jgi:hypothetical protein